MYFTAGGWDSNSIIHIPYIRKMSADRSIGHSQSVDTFDIELSDFVIARWVYGYQSPEFPPEVLHPSNASTSTIFRRITSLSSCEEAEQSLKQGAGVSSTDGGADHGSPIMSWGVSTNSSCDICADDS